MKKTALIILSLFMSMVTFSQSGNENPYSIYEKPYFDNIVKNATSTPLPKKAKDKMVSFPRKYVIAGKIYKKILVDGTMITINDPLNNRTLQGQYKLVDGRSVVHGKLDYKYEGKEVTSYGSFSVSNGNNELIMNPKKASDLFITEMRLDMWSGFWNEYPCLLKKQSYGYLLSIKSLYKGWRYLSLEAGISDAAVRSFGHEDIGKLLLSDTLDVNIVYRDGTEFSGRAFGQVSGKEDIQFVLLEGKKTDRKSGTVTIVEKIMDVGGYRKYVLKTFTPESSEVAEESFPLVSSSINIDSLWDKSYYMANSSEISIKYANEDRYSGKFIVVDGQAITTDGTYLYKNGDRFKGNLSGEYFGGMPVDGTTTFKDGTVEEGNWLKKYLLTDNQLKEISVKKPAPSEAMMMAVSYVKDNNFKQLLKAAETYEELENFEKAKSLYQQALTYKSDDGISDRIKELDKKIQRQKLVKKYGSRYADNILNGIIETGMTKEMCELVLEMDFYRVSTWTDFAGDQMETWEFDYDYGIDKENSKMLKENIKENAVAGLLIYGLMSGVKHLTSGYASSMAKYKYLKFRNSVLIELKDRSVYDDSNKSKRDIINGLLQLFGE